VILQLKRNGSNLWLNSNIAPRTFKFKLRDVHFPVVKPKFSIRSLEVVGSSPESDHLQIHVFAKKKTLKIEILVHNAMEKRVSTIF
jgi:hypothetical protein